MPQLNFPVEKPYKECIDFNEYRVPQQSDAFSRVVSVSICDVWPCVDFVTSIV